MTGYWGAHIPGNGCPCKPGIAMSSESGFSYRHNGPGLDTTPVPEEAKEEVRKLHQEQFYMHPDGRMKYRGKL